MKMLISDKITLDVFCENPIKLLESSKNGLIEILQKNSPVFYAITPQLLKKIFDIEYSSFNQINTQKHIEKKFAMHDKWIPDKDFIHQAALWGIMLTEEVLESELMCFIAYWQAEGCFFYHIQWQQKLARSLQKSRSLNYITPKKRDITHIPTPDRTVPNGFRGK